MGGFLTSLVLAKMSGFLGFKTLKIHYYLVFDPLWFLCLVFWGVGFLINRTKY